MFFISLSLWSLIKSSFKTAVGEKFGQIRSKFSSLTSGVLDDLAVVLEKNYGQTEASKNCASVSVEEKKYSSIRFYLLPVYALGSSEILDELINRLSNNHDLNALKNKLKISDYEWKDILKLYCDLIVKYGLKKTLTRMKKDDGKLGQYYIISLDKNFALPIQKKDEYVDIVVLHYFYKQPTRREIHHVRKIWAKRNNKNLKYEKGFDDFGKTI